MYMFIWSVMVQPELSNQCRRDSFGHSKNCSNCLIVSYSSIGLPLCNRWNIIAICFCFLARSSFTSWSRIVTCLLAIRLAILLSLIRYLQLCVMYHWPFCMPLLGITLLAFFLPPCFFKVSYFDWRIFSRTSKVVHTIYLIESYKPLVPFMHSAQWSFVVQDSWNFLVIS